MDGCVRLISHRYTGLAWIWSRWGRYSGNYPPCQYTDPDCRCLDSQHTRYDLRKEETIIIIITIIIISHTHTMSNMRWDIFITHTHTHSPTHCWVGVCRYPGLHSQRKLPGTFRQTAFCWHTGPFWHSSISAHTSFTEHWEILSQFLFVIADLSLSRGITRTLIW